MKIRKTDHGLTVDAADLGPLLGIPAAEVPAKMRAGEITSQAPSPKYGVHLAFVLCSLPTLGNSLTVDVHTSLGTLKGQLTSLPFNFEALGLTPQLAAE